MKKHIEEYFFSIQDLQNLFLFKVISFHPYDWSFKFKYTVKYLVRIVIELTYATVKCNYIYENFLDPNFTNVV